MELPDFLSRTEKGGIRITGHRIDLYHIMLLYEEGFSAEMIHLDYPTLPLALIYKVMAFYLENKAEVDAYVAEVDAQSKRRMAAAPRTPTVEELPDGWPPRQARLWRLSGHGPAIPAGRMTGALSFAIVRHNATSTEPLHAQRVGDAVDLPLGTGDPEILRWAGRGSCRDHP